MTKQAKRPLWRRILSALGGTLLTVVLLAVFYVTVVLGQPQKDLEGGVDLTQPLLSPAPAINLSAKQALDGVLATFPVPVLCCAPGGSLELTGGTSYDTAFEAGVARILTLEYADMQGHALQVTSIYPARALPLIETAGWHLMGAGPSLAGQSAVRMEQGDQLRLHAQSAEGLYVVTTQKLPQEELQELLRPLQLLGADK